MNKNKKEKGEGIELKYALRIKTYMIRVQKSLGHVWKESHIGIPSEKNIGVQTCSEFQINIPSKKI